MFNLMEENIKLIIQIASLILLGSALYWKLHYTNKEQNQKIEEIKKDLKEIKNNHLSHIWDKLNHIDKEVGIMATSFNDHCNNKYIHNGNKH